jgi:hypothetical protein
MCHTNEATVAVTLITWQAKAAARHTNVAAGDTNVTPVDTNVTSGDTTGASPDTAVVSPDTTTAIARAYLSALSRSTIAQASKGTMISWWPVIS